jgi:hypothetical protein
MKNSMQRSFCLIATIFIGTALAQTSTAQTIERAAASSSSPVAYVFERTIGKTVEPVHALT